MCADLVAAVVHIEAASRLAIEFGLESNVPNIHQARARLHLQEERWDAAIEEAALGAARDRAAGRVPNELLGLSQEAEAAWRAGRADAAVAIWQHLATAFEQRGEEELVRAPRLRLADMRAASGQPEEVEAARQTVLAELAAAECEVPLKGEFGLAARLAAWRVLHRAGDPAAAGQLALAAAELEQALSGFDEPHVRERVAHVIPWHRDVVEALGRSTAAAPAGG